MKSDIADKLRAVRSALDDFCKETAAYYTTGGQDCEKDGHELLEAGCKALADLPDPDAVVPIEEVGKCSDKLQEVAQQRDELAALLRRTMSDTDVSAFTDDTPGCWFCNCGSGHDPTCEAAAALAKLEKP